jgi:hypothetical protein
LTEAGSATGFIPESRQKPGVKAPGLSIMGRKEVVLMYYLRLKFTIRNIVAEIVLTFRKVR